MGGSLAEPIRDADPGEKGYSPGVFFYGVTIVAVLPFLVAEGFATISWWLLLVALLGILAWFVMALLWLAMFAWTAFRSRLRMTRRAWARWLGIPAVVVLCLVLMVTDAPLRFRFDLSRSAFDQAASQVRAGNPITPGWIGLFLVDDVAHLPGGVLFFNNDADECGVLYAANGPVTFTDPGFEFGGGWSYACP